MIKIKDQQALAIEEAQEREYHERLATFLRQAAPDATAVLDDDHLFNLVASSVRRARGYGVATTAGILQFITLALMVGPTFDDPPAVRSYLSLPGADPDLKVRHLAKRFVQHLRELADQASTGGEG